MFSSFEIAAFLRDHWQRSPLLIRNPWAAWSNPLPADELAGLACESALESRLVIGDAASGWVCENGPLDGDRFAALGARPWTVLVQAVDHHVPGVAALIAPFRFIPDWRIDDVMVSYASDGGGVGPHFDNYDVFLIQGQGRRRWRLGPVCDDDTPLRPHEELRLLADFVPGAEHVLQPGDILYVPPGVAHEGVALDDDCMTYSIGFRAPSREELIAGWSEQVLEGARDDDRYADPGLTRQPNPGEIAPAALAALQALIAEKLLDSDGFARWFGNHATTPKYPDIDWGPDQPLTPARLRQRLAKGAALFRNPASRLSFIRRGEDAVWLFVDGENYDCMGEAAAFAARICAGDVTEVVEDPMTLELILSLYNRGAISFDPA